MLLVITNYVRHWDIVDGNSRDARIYWALIQPWQHRLCNLVCTKSVAMAPEIVSGILDFTVLNDITIVKHIARA